MTLDMTNAYTNPFELVCAKCNSLIITAKTMNEIMLYCAICNENYHFVYFHQLNYIIHENDRTKIQCVLRGVELEKVLLELQKVSDEKYYADILVVIDFLSSFETHEKFTINHQTVIIRIQ